jgi:sugar/nucleoside kinase (ribokinase family)
MEYDVVTFGDLVTDIHLPIPSLPVVPQDIQIAHQKSTQPGGAGNFLITAQRLGLRTAALGYLGADPYGELCLEKLNAESVDIAAVRLLAGESTTLVIVLIDDAGQHAFLGALGSIQIPEIESLFHEKISNARALFSNGYAFLECSPPQILIELMRQARLNEKLVCFDPGPQIQQVDVSLMRAAIAETDILLLTQDEAAALVQGDTPEELAQNLLHLGPELIALKMGAQGCLVANPQTMLRTPAFQLPVRDTTGCGDAFNAAFVYGIISQMPLDQIGRFANAAGGAAVSKMGAGTGLPHRSEIEGIFAASDL